MNMKQEVSYLLAIIMLISLTSTALAETNLYLIAGDNPSSAPMGQTQTLLLGATIPDKPNFENEGYVLSGPYFEWDCLVSWKGGPRAMSLSLVSDGLNGARYNVICNNTTTYWLTCQVWGYYWAAALFEFLESYAVGEQYDGFDWVVSGY
jgi:hypothetical protein